MVTQVPDNVYEYICLATRKSLEDNKLEKKEEV